MFVFSLVKDDFTSASFFTSTSLDTNFSSFFPAPRSLPAPINVPWTANVAAIPTPAITYAGALAVCFKALVAVESSFSWLP